MIPIIDFPIKKKKILIVDDNEILLRTLKKMLDDLIKIYNEDFEIIMANDGLDILNQVIADQYKGNLIKCIITDENMEFINGSEAVNFLSNLKRKNKIRDVNVIFLSSYDDDYMFNNTKAQNCHYLSKPISIKILEKKLKEIEIFDNFEF